MLIDYRIPSSFMVWVGGKRKLKEEIKNLVPNKINIYYEPFIGGGAILFHLRPNKAVINDFNKELINVYKTIKENPEELITDLRTHKTDSDYFYDIRSLDRKNDFLKLSNIKRASRFIYITNHSYNGLYRVNNSGYINSPFNKELKRKTFDEDVIRSVSNYLNDNNITILNGDFEDALKGIKKGDFVYFDPPYHPVSASLKFTGYVQGGFLESDQIRLKVLCDKLNDEGVKFLLSNSDTQFINDIYKGYIIHSVSVKRTFSPDKKNRKEIKEVLIRNYEII